MINMHCMKTRKGYRLKPPLEIYLHKVCMLVVKRITFQIITLRFSLFFGLNYGVKSVVSKGIEEYYLRVFNHYALARGYLKVWRGLRIIIFLKVGFDWYCLDCNYCQEWHNTNTIHDATLSAPKLFPNRCSSSVRLEYIWLFASHECQLSFASLFV